MRQVSRRELLSIRNRVAKQERNFSPRKGVVEPVLGVFLVSGQGPS
jgi:hypothetical protein